MTEEKTKKTDETEKAYLSYGKTFADFLSIAGVIFFIASLAVSFVFIAKYSEQYHSLDYSPLIYVVYGILSWLFLQFASVALRLLIDIKTELYKK